MFETTLLVTITNDNNLFRLTAENDWYKINILCTVPYQEHANAKDFTPMHLNHSFHTKTTEPSMPELHAYSDFDKRSGTIILHYYIEPLPYIPKSVPIIMSDQIPDFIQKLQIAGQTLQELQTLIQQYFPGISFDTKEEPSCVPKP